MVASQHCSFDFFFKLIIKKIKTETLCLFSNNQCYQRILFTADRMFEMIFYRCFIICMASKQSPGQRIIVEGMCEKYNEIFNAHSKLYHSYPNYIPLFNKVVMAVPVLDWSDYIHYYYSRKREL